VSLKAIVFDFDGVIANSEPLHLRAFQDVLAEKGISLSRAEYYARYLGYDDAGAFRVIGADRGVSWSDRDVAGLIARKARAIELLEQNTPILFPGAADAIRRAAGAVPIAIASGALGHEIRRVLDRARLTQLFTAIVAAEDTPASKPAPDPYLRAVEQLASALPQPLAASDCIAVEDSVWGLESARAAGLRTVAVAQTYGRDALSSADLIIDDIAELSLDTLRTLVSI
jgi:beta-phosphoglucomutase-like phosphatase (HAD superfamily)